MDKEKFRVLPVLIELVTFAQRIKMMKLLLWLAERESP